MSHQATEAASQTPEVAEEAEAAEAPPAEASSLAVAQQAAFTEQATPLSDARSGASEADHLPRGPCIHSTLDSTASVLEDPRELRSR